MSEKIEIFTTPSCPYCTKIKDWLEMNDYDYIEHNVAKDREKAKEMVERTGQRGVPQTMIGEQTVIGFQPDKLQKAIKSEIET